MKTNTINTLNIAIANAITAIATDIVAVPSSVMSSWLGRSSWPNGRSEMRGNKRVVMVSEHKLPVMGQPAFGHHLLGLIGHRFGLAALAPTPAMACCTNYRSTQPSRPRFA